MDREITIKEPTLRNILSYLEPYNRQRYESEREEVPEYEEAVWALWDALKRMPDCMYRLRGSYTLPNYTNREADLFYISDMGMLRNLLEKKRYGAFIHEICDFLNFKIMQDDVESGPEYLPKNIKDALIYTIEDAKGM